VRTKPATIATDFSRAALRGAASAAIVLLTLLTLGASPDVATSELAARSQRVAEMDPAQQQELLRKFERFETLSPAEQDRLRKLQAEITADPNSQRLLEILERYHEWLKTITPAQRAKLADLSAKQRVREIEHILRAQRDAQRLEPLTPQDMHEIRRWVDDLIDKYREELVESLPSRYRSWYDRQTDPGSKQMTLVFPLFGYSRERDIDSKITSGDIDELAGKLSNTAQTELAKAESLEEKQKLVGGWMFASMRRSWSWHRGRRSNPVVTEELLQFLQNDVPPTDRQRLLKLPRDEMLQELRKMYFERSFGERPEGRSDHDRRERSRGRGPGSERPEPSPDEKEGERS
jgi:hypothetical protein